MKLFLVLLVVVPSVIAVRRTGNVILVDSFTWDLQVPRFKIGSKSAITVSVTAGIARQSDSISGENLWRLGIFGSKYTNGSGERINFREQILTPKQASKQPIRRNPLKFKNVQSRFDLSQIGCGELRYFCVELNKNPDSTVDFELRWGTELDGIVGCRELECRLPGDNVPADEMVMTCSQPCPPPEDAGGPVCGSNRQQYNSLCELDKAARCEGVEVELDYEGDCRPKIIASSMWWDFRSRTNVDNPNLANLSIDGILFSKYWHNSIKGEDLWQVSMFGSENEQGTGVRYNNVEKALDQSGSMIWGMMFFPEFSMSFNMSGVGCGNVRYLCLEMKDNPEASTPFILKKASSGERGIVNCRNLRCMAPSWWKHLIIISMKASLEKDVFRSGEPSDLSLTLSMSLCPRSSGILGGKNLWRVGIYGSQNENGYGEKLNFIQQLLNESQSLHSPHIIPGAPFDFPTMSFQYDISAIGCGEYQYLCIVVGKGPNATPNNFSINKRLVSCRRVQCTDQTELSGSRPTRINLDKKF